MSRSVSRSMGEPKQTRRSLRLSALVWLLGLGACTSVLGIEDLHDGARPGSAGDGNGATENTSGTNNAGGKSSGGSTTGGKSSGGGTTGNPAGAGNEPSGGTSGTLGGTGSGNEAGAGGAAEPPMAGPVTGKVIDRWSVPVANVTVQIGADKVLTGSNGVFTVPNAPATYDVSLLIDTLGDGWVYEGLTGRDPTLQVFQGHPYRSNYVALTPSNATLLTNEELSLAVGTPTGSAENSDSGIDSPPLSVYTAWEGGTTTQSTFHGLKWLKNATTALPVTYKAYDSKPLALTASVDGAVTLDFTVKTIAGAAITGTVTPIADPDSQGPRTNSMFVRFGSGASIKVVDDTPTANAFSYVAPTLPAADSPTMTVAAWEGNSSLGPMGLVHKDGLKPGDAAGTLVIPTAPSGLKVSPQTTSVDEATTFSFNASPDNAGAFVVIFGSDDTGNHLYVVTTRKSFKLASLVGAPVFEHATGTDKAATYLWWVETHGHFASVDAMTGSNGYVDEFGMNYTTPVAVHQADGTYTSSLASGFTTKNQ